MALDNSPASFGLIRLRSFSSITKVKYGRKKNLYIKSSSKKAWSSTQADVLDN